MGNFIALIFVIGIIGAFAGRGFIRTIGGTLVSIAVVLFALVLFAAQIIATVIGILLAVAAIAAIVVLWRLAFARRH